MDEVRSPDLQTDYSGSICHTDGLVGAGGGAGAAIDFDPEHCWHSLLETEPPGPNVLCDSGPAIDPDLAPSFYPVLSFRRGLCPAGRVKRRALARSLWHRRSASDRRGLKVLANSAGVCQAICECGRAVL